MSCVVYNCADKTLLDISGVKELVKTLLDIYGVKKLVKTLLDMYGVKKFVKTLEDTYIGNDKISNFSLPYR